SMLWGCVSVALSIATRAACVRVWWGSPGSVSVREMLFGYAVEPNAGLWYLFGASACFLTGFGFLEAAHRGLARSNIAVPSTEASAGRPAALEQIGLLNRRYFRYGTPFIILFAVGFVAVPELVFRGA